MVVPLDAWLPDALMQAMAAEHNVSETAFLVPESEGCWHLRWFTPTLEVALCGHATLATAHVLAAELGVGGPMRFRTASGPLDVERDGARLVLDFPADPPRPAEAPPGLAEALGAAPREVWKARDWICVFGNAAEVCALRPDHARLARLPDPPGEISSVVATAPGEDGHDCVSRYFAAKLGIPEDPVTGGAHTQVVPYWAARLGRNALACRQASARGGTLRCELRGARVRMTGACVTYARSELVLPDLASFAASSSRPST